MGFLCQIKIDLKKFLGPKIQVCCEFGQNRFSGSDGRGRANH